MMGEMKSGLVINPYKYRITRRKNRGQYSYAVNEPPVVFCIERGIKGIPFFLFRRRLRVVSCFDTACTLFYSYVAEDSAGLTRAWYPQPEKAAK